MNMKFIIFNSADLVFVQPPIPRSVAEIIPSKNPFNSAFSSCIQPLAIIIGMNEIFLKYYFRVFLNGDAMKEKIVNLVSLVVVIFSVLIGLARREDTPEKTT